MPLSNVSVTDDTIGTITNLVTYCLEILKTISNSMALLILMGMVRVLETDLGGVTTEYKFA